LRLGSGRPSWSWLMPHVLSFDAGAVFLLAILCRWETYLRSHKSREAGLEETEKTLLDNEKPEREESRGR